MWSLWHQLAWGWSLHENLQLHITPVHVIVSVNSCVGIDTKINSVGILIINFNVYVFCLKVVGSQARILYSNEEGRVKIALAFNKAIGEGRLKGKTCVSSVSSQS